MKTSQKGFSVPLVATIIASVAIVVVCLIYAIKTPSNKSDANDPLKKEVLVLPSEVLGAPKCKKQYTTKGATNEEKYFSKMDCIPQLDQINYWESEDYLKKFDSIPVKVAVIDAYFNTNHPDLKNAIIKTYSLAKASCYPVDLSKSDCLGVLPPNVPVTSENITGLNHGSIIAGVIAGQGAKGQGMVGINPSAQLILISKIANPNDAEGYLRALQGAIDLKPDVISMSFPLGVPPGDSASVDLKTRFEELLKQAVSKGIVVTLAAGNYSLDVNTKEIYPTRLSTIDGVISVGARDYESLAKYSNYGTNFVGISAPGLVRSTAGKTQDNSPYMLSAGTSFAGPLVAGAASRVIQILKSKNISYTPSDIENILYLGSDIDSNLKDKFTNGRTLNLKTLAYFVSNLEQKDFPVLLNITQKQPTKPAPVEPVITPNSNSTAYQNIQKKVEAQVLSYIDTTGKTANKTPGMVVGVITKDFTGSFGFGTKVINTNQKPDGDTFFDIGSVSKVFTGVILADEVSKGSINFDQSVTDFMEGTLKSLLPKSLTFRNLVTHTSGLNSMPENIKGTRVGGADGYVWWAPARNYERADLSNCLQKGKCMPNPNNVDESAYSNLGISILGMALQDKLGFSSFDEMLRAKISNPLDMADTGTNVPAFISKIASRSATGYGMNAGVLTATPHADMGSMSPAGEIITTADDLLKFMAVLTGINTNVLGEALTHALVPLTTMNATKKVGYAIAIEGADTNSPVYSKSGGTPGFSSYIIWTRNPQIGIVVLANKNGLELSTIAESVLNSLK